MSVFTYTAKRNVAADHIVDTTYSIDVSFQDIQEISKIDRKDHRSISGKQESYLRRIEKYITVRTMLIDEASALRGHIDEMLDSVAGGELLSFDRWGSVSSPDSAQNVTLESSGVNLQRMDGIRHFIYSFKLRVSL